MGPSGRKFCARRARLLVTGCILATAGEPKSLFRLKLMARSRRDACVSSRYPGYHAVAWVRSRVGVFGLKLTFESFVIKECFGGPVSSFKGKSVR